MKVNSLWLGDIIEESIILTETGNYLFFINIRNDYSFLSKLSHFHGRPLSWVRGTGLRNRQM